MKTMKSLLLTATLLAGSATASSAAVLDTFGDKDCFGIGGACTDGTRLSSFPSRSSTFQEDRLLSGGTGAWTHTFAAGSYTNAVLTFRTVGLADVGGPYSVMGDGVVIGTIPLDPPSNFDIETYSFSIDSSLLLDGSLSLSFNVDSGDGWAFDFAELTGDLSTAPAVPLPAAGWMLVAGLGGLAAMRRRKRQ